MSTRLVGYETLMNAQAVAQAATGYSDSMKFDRLTGEVCVFAVSASAGAATITITQQCSMDDTNWYDPVNSAGSAVGSVQSALAVTAGKWIVYSPILAPYGRFKVVEGNTAACTVTLKLIFQEE